MSDSSENRKLTPRLWVQRYGDLFYQYALRRLNDRQAAEDVVQETFLAAIKSSVNFRGDSLESTWLSSIMRKKTIDVIRKRERARSNRSGADDPELNDVSQDQCLNVIGASFSIAPSKALSDAELREEVQNCLRGIPKNQADVFVLREVEQLEPEAICEMLNISRKNLWVRLYRARVALAKCISEKLVDDNRARPYDKVKSNGDEV